MACRVLMVSVSEDVSIVATGPSTILGGGMGMFIFNEEYHSNSLDIVVEKEVVIGWFELYSHE